MRINGDTKIYGLIGYPVKHTLSPLMHNAAFCALDINAIYVPFEVKPENLRRNLDCMELVGVCGLNVTVPHKEKVLRHLDDIDREAALIGAVNTIVFKGGRLKGHNTDGRGFVSALKEDFGMTPKGRSFFILGAGGASRAISFSLALRGAARIVIMDIFREKAIKLARELTKKTPCESIALKQDRRAMREMLLNTDVLINATPCGLRHGDPGAIETGLLHGGLCVVDLIYNPSTTKLLREAKKKGARVSNGIGMLLRQGAGSFRLWTGKNPPPGVMKKALQKVLSRC